jgi:tetratricopeptide (TPR) repeat protein
MKKTLVSGPKPALVALTAVLAAMTPNSRSQEITPPPMFMAVAKTISAENLKAAASRTTDPEVLLGFAFLAPKGIPVPKELSDPAVKAMWNRFVAPGGPPVRKEISDLAVKGRPDYGPIAAVLAVAMDGADGRSIAELIKRDPDNALGYYLEAHRLYRSGKEKESLEAFRKAAACPELRLYASTTADALFKALDALSLTGRERLLVLCSLAVRVEDFYTIDLQPLRGDLWEMARKADLGTRKEISDLLLVVGGHLFATTFQNRDFAQWAVQAAFRLKAEIAAAEKSPTMNGYVAVVQALVSVRRSWPGIEERKNTPLEVAEFLPGAISRAFALADPSLVKAAALVELRANVPDSDKPAFEKAKQEAARTASALVDVALTDPDGIIGAYLRGLPPAGTNTPRPWVSRSTYVEKLMLKRPDVFKAAAAHEQAMQALNQAGSSDPRTRNMQRLMELGWAVQSYASDHDQTLPPSLEVLFEKGKYLKDPSQARSVLTGRPYVFIVAGEKLPEKRDEREKFILAYDDKEQDGSYECVLAAGHGGSMRVSEVKEQIRQRGK